MILSSGRPLIFSSGEVGQMRFSGQTQTVGENDPVRRRAAILSALSSTSRHELIATFTDNCWDVI